MTNINENILNLDKTDYDVPSLLMGQKMGIFDTINRHFPEIWEIYKTQKSLDWDEAEFDYSSCVRDFQTCPTSVYDMMVKTLAWQWEADSCASRAIAPVLAPFISNSELWAAWLKVTEIEVLHAATYSEIVRNSFNDPSEILDEILRVEEAHSRLKTISNIFAEGFEASHKYAIGQLPNDQDTYNKVFMMIIALLCLERIQFMASFAVTFAICDTGLFQPIGKAVQKIAQDEFEVHVQLDKAVLRHELKTERGKVAYAQCKPLIEQLVSEVVNSEIAWVDYLFSEGRELVGINKEMLSKWVLFCSRDVYTFLDLPMDEFTFPRENPLKFMEKWLDISKTQPAPQEQDIAAYKVGTLRRDDDDVEFDIDF